MSGLSLRRALRRRRERGERDRRRIRALSRLRRVAVPLVEATAPTRSVSER